MQYRCAASTPQLLEELGGIPNLSHTAKEKSRRASSLVNKEAMPCHLYAYRNPRQLSIYWNVCSRNQILQTFNMHEYDLPWTKTHSTILHSSMNPHKLFKNPKVLCNIYQLLWKKWPYYSFGENCNPYNNFWWKQRWRFSNMTIFASPNLRVLLVDKTLHLRTICCQHQVHCHPQAEHGICKIIAWFNGIRTEGLVSLDFVSKFVKGVAHKMVSAHSWKSSVRCKTAYGSLGLLLDNLPYSFSILFCNWKAWLANISNTVIIYAHSLFIRISGIESLLHWLMILFSHEILFGYYTSLNKTVF